MADLARAKRYARRPFNAPLDESISPDRNPGLVQAQNVVYRRFGAVGKRTGSGTYGGNGSVGVTGSVISGVRWYRGRPSTLAQMIVQAGDQLWLGDDVHGTFTSIGALAAGSSPAFYASCFDPNANGGAGADILIIAYGSGPPMKWDGTSLSQLNASITNHFTGCTFWHEHVWFWGDPANPDTVYATDLGNPESYTFSTNFGGYQVGRGDGDSLVQVVVPLGGTLAVFKTRSIYAISGYDFYQGDYQFQDQPWITDNGTTAPHSVKILRGSLMWWNGQSFYQLAPGTAQPVNVGAPVVKTASIAAQHSQSVICATAGDFLVASIDGYTNYTGFYACAIDSGTGTADTICVYDDDASQYYGKPAWSKWTGLPVGCFVPWGGPGDQKLLFIGSASGAATMLQLGANATADSSNFINVVIQTGRDNCGEDETLKHMSALYLSAETNEAQFVVTTQSDLYLNSASSSSATVTPPSNVAVVGTAIVGQSIVGPALATLYQIIATRISPSLDGHNFQFTISEFSTTSAYEIVALAVLITEESLAR